ncbi:N-methyl-L-tryptophan oxidase [Paenibacillus lycopersici]|uniref:N-methyl-L-tryptophan oxidase n=1 Tax=Paenibacillus lycopersici TaxID=2704462 RepID=A0A6C0FYX5_9BACL|nr:N-methyl-L-tryptophan oxidase [Paenibacillus lycopersici]QHT61282.1 N-methyl-L-tryptophan oxidase [Paenibacillus lycopersici]
MEHYDVIVIGAGAMGMSAGYHAAASGRSALMIDAFDPPHAQGTHHGETRIIRHAYGEGREYTPMALRAQALWAELERETGRELFLKTGFLQAGEPNSRMLGEMIVSARENGLPAELLDGAQMRKRWPGLTLPESFAGCYEADSGVLLSEACVQAYRDAAVARGAAMLADTPVVAVRPDAGGADVVTAQGTFRAKSLVVTAGKFAGPMLAKLGLKRMPLAPIRKTVEWFRPATADYAPDRFPAFLFDLPEGIYFGFPDIGGEGVKAGRHDGGFRPMPEDGVLPAHGAFADDGADCAAYVRRYMPGVVPDIIRGSACTYTMTPDEHFILDRHPDYPHVAIGAGFSGHGFKFASAIGEILAALAAGEEPGFDLSLFALRRFNQLTTREG